MAKALEKRVEEQAKLTKPDKIYWCDGSEEEAAPLIEIDSTVFLWAPELDQRLPLPPLVNLENIYLKKYGTNIKN
jgi:hypothetical protein